MATAHLVFQIGQSNEYGWGMSTTGLPTSYYGHDLSNTGDSLYTGDVKIWNGSAWANLSQALSMTGLGPQLFIGARMLDLWPAGDCYIVKYAINATGANQSSTSNNWSVEDYSHATRGLLRIALNYLVDAINNLLLTYDDVKIELVSMTQGEEDSTTGLWAYNYGGNLQNIVARISERLSLTDGNLPYFCWVQPVIPRDTAASSNYCAEYGHIIRAGAAKTIDRVKAIHGANRATVVDTTGIYEAGDLANDDLHWTNQGQQKKVDAIFTAYLAAVSAGYTAPIKLPAWSEDTTFDALPTFTQVTAPATSYLPNIPVTAELSANNFDGGYSGSQVIWSCDDDPLFSATGFELSATPRKLNGLCIRARYENAKHYLAHYFAWTNVTEVRDLSALGTPKLWARSSIDNVISNATTYEISRINNHSGSNTSYAWQANTGAPKATHRGVAMMKSSYIRALEWNGSTFTTTTASQTNASLTDTGSWVRFAKFKVNFVSSSTVGHVFGVRASTTFGGGIALAATANGLTTVSPIGRRGTTQLVPTTGNEVDMGNAGDEIVVAYRKNGTSFTLHYFNGSGVSIIGPVTYGSMSDGYPDSIGFGSSLGFEGVFIEGIGAEVAPTDAEVENIILQLSASDIPIVAQSTVTLQSVTNSGIGELSPIITGSSAVTLANTSIIKEKVWVQITDSTGNRTTTSLDVPLQVGSLIVNGTSTRTLTQVGNSGIGAVTAPDQATGISTVTLASVSTTKEKAWVQIRDTVGNRTTTSLNVPSQVGTVSLIATGTSTVTLSSVVVQRERVWVQIRDNIGNRTTTSIVVPEAFGTIQSAISGTSSTTLNNVTRSASGTLFAGMSLVTLQEPLWLGSGSIVDPAYWTGTPPAAGDQIYYPNTDDFVIASNGAMSATTNEGSWAIFYSDGSGWYSTTITFVAGIAGASTKTLNNVANTYLGVIPVVAASTVTLSGITRTQNGSLIVAGTQSATLSSIAVTQTGGVEIAGVSSVTLSLSGWNQQGYVGSAPRVCTSTVDLDSISNSYSGSVVIGGSQQATLSSITVTQTGGVLISGTSTKLLSAIIQQQEGTLGITPRYGISAVSLTNVSNSGIAYVIVHGSGIKTLAAVTTIQRGSVYNQNNAGISNIVLNSIIRLGNGFTDVTNFISCTGTIYEIEDSVLSTTATVITATGYIVELADEIKERIYLDGGTVPSTLATLKNLTILSGR